ncbi:MAG: Na+/H+ antiporter NhaA [Riemerella sp.]|nr:MAG: Na+/H+ antiporter NhaA [Riemerella sp.]
MRITKFFKEFFSNSQSSGILLVFCVLISLMIANSSASEGFQSFLDQSWGPYSVSVWINDGLMAVFFLLVGLEIKRELLDGELSNFKNASLPILAAIGGMLVPAVIFTLFNHGTEYSKGWAIPMATDIAFSLAIISMLGKSVPSAVKVFLAALAIVDDLGAIVVIAIFYTDEIHWNYLLYSGIIVAILAVLNFLKVKKHIFYLIPGCVLWYFMHHSGIHATIAGVILAFCIPASKADNEEPSPLEKLEHFLHIPVSYAIMPIFALANTNITFKEGMVDGLFSNFGYGIVFGLILGKLIGINLFSFIAIKLKISSLPDKSRWVHMIGAGLLAGIGFTMSIFIALLSYKDNQDLQDSAKFAILTASVLAGFLGYLLLKSTAKNENSI